MPIQLPSPDPLPSAEVRLKVAALSEAQLQALDDALLRHVSDDWRKIARVVGTAMGESALRAHGLPDIFYAERVRHLIETGVLEAQGNVRTMGLGEVRLQVERRDAV
jgi:hypothetical protein